jgi:type II secretory pathway pseudopilin PulG
MELMTTIVVIGILLAMLIPAFNYVRARAEMGGCTNNLKTLYTAGVTHITEHGHWPQISERNMRSPEFHKEWIGKFERYGVARSNWVCPSIQRLLKAPDLQKYPRVDYVGTTFDDKPMSAYQWPHHPWFIENGSMHGDGNLVIFTNGQIKTMRDIQRDTRTQHIR